MRRARKLRARKASDELSDEQVVSIIAEALAAVGRRLDGIERAVSGRRDALDGLAARLDAREAGAARSEAWGRPAPPLITEDDNPQ